MLAVEVVSVLRPSFRAKLCAGSRLIAGVRGLAEFVKKWNFAWLCLFVGVGFPVVPGAVAVVGVSPGKSVAGEI